MAKTPKAPARCTEGRLKQIRNFRLVSQTDSRTYGNLGSPKWAQELHRYLGDKRVTEKDVRRWVQTKREVTDPLPSKPKTRSESKKLLNDSTPVRIVAASAGSSYWKSRNSMQNRKQPVSISSTPRSVRSETLPVSVFEEQDVTPNPPPKYSQHEFRAKTRLQRPDRNATPQYEDSVHENVLKDVRSGFTSLLTLENLKSKYGTAQPSFVKQIRTLFKEVRNYREVNNISLVSVTFSRPTEIDRQIALGKITMTYQMEGDLNHLDHQSDEENKLPNYQEKDFDQELYHSFQ